MTIAILIVGGVTVHFSESWFIKTTAVKEKMQLNNQGVQWYPSHLKDGRFGKLLDNMVDWNIGRNRYWGTPLNVWLCKECGKEKVPNSIRELREHAVEDLPEDIELHKPFVDKVQLTCTCGGKMDRTSEVIDDVQHFKINMKRMLVSTIGREQLFYIFLLFKLINPML